MSNLKPVSRGRSVHRQRKSTFKKVFINRVHQCTPTLIAFCSFSTKKILLLRLTLVADNIASRLGSIYSPSTCIYISDVGCGFRRRRTERPVAMAAQIERRHEGRGGVVRISPFFDSQSVLAATRLPTNHQKKQKTAYSALCCDIVLSQQYCSELLPFRDMPSA